MSKIRKEKEEKKRKEKEKRENEKMRKKTKKTLAKTARPPVWDGVGIFQYKFNREYKP